MKQKLLHTFRLRATLLVAVMCAAFSGTAWAVPVVRYDKMIGSRFLLVEHTDLLVENGKDLFESGVAALNNKSYILISAFLTTHFHRPHHILLLLLSSVKPAQKQPCTLSLLSAVSATHIKENIRILSEKLLNDTNNGLRNLRVAWRRTVVHIREIEPIRHVVRIGIIVKGDRIFNAVVRSEKYRTIMVIADIIGCAQTDGFNVQTIHGSYPFKVIEAGLGSRFFAALSLFPLQPRLLHALLFDLSPSVKPLDNFIARTQLDISHCLHDIFIGVGSTPQRYTLYANHSTSDRTFYTNPH